MNKKNKAFSLIEILLSMAIFAASIGPISNCFTACMSIPKLDNVAISLIADFDNCIAHINDIPSGVNAKPSGNVHSLFAPESTFQASKRILEARNNFALYEVTIGNYPGVNGKISAVSYIFEP
ncbi:MAG: prepilin-type N-terminal cleavage/methylation domain-containing protein [Puniceicoccales bacterium]|jgi:prepilin-type N-terminal cleavage/methylation domain-containing protein|nr:prepilin-type N-terminal cleavage/methylation domain-containing protein [Puniceicoccales bacterium]